MITSERIFTNREEAGKKLGRALRQRYGDGEALVLGFPVGGIVVAREVAEMLHAQFSVIITKSIPHPDQPDVSLGSLTEDGAEFLLPEANEVPSHLLRTIIANQIPELRRRMRKFRNDVPLPAIKDRVVILVDDGLSQYHHLIAAIALCRKQQAARVVVASPVAGRRIRAEIETLADDVIILSQPEMFYAVAQVYDRFSHLTDEDVIPYLSSGKTTPIPVLAASL